MAKAKKSEVVIEEDEETGEETPAGTSTKTGAKGADWKKLAVIGAFTVAGLYFLFGRKKNDQKSEKPAPGSPGNAPSGPGAGSGDRFALVRTL